MSEFASAAMIRVLAQGMREHGLDPGPRAPRLGEARVDLGLKRSLVRDAIAQGGLACLPRLGQGVHALTHEPIHHALASATGPIDLIERWQRLERYIHSRHRCALRDAGPQHVRIAHGSIGASPPPLPAEDLVVVGVLAALLEVIGARGVKARIGPVVVLPLEDPSSLEALARTGRTAEWELGWDRLDPRPSVPSVTAEDGQAPASCRPDAAWPPVARRVWSLATGDLTRRLYVDDLAAATGLPVRTLQRELARAGLTLSSLLAEARCRCAAARLLESDGPIAEIGFLCGFADQPHFTRELQRRVGLTPAAYREAFRVGAPASPASGRLSPRVPGSAPPAPRSARSRPA